MKHKLPNYLRAHRKRWSLTQEELAHLLGLTSQGAVSQYEGLPKRPGVEILIAAKTLFGVPCRTMFPQVYEEVERDLVRRAKEMRDRLQLAPNGSTEVKLRLLDELVDRIESHTNDI